MQTVVATTNDDIGLDFTVRTNLNPGLAPWAVPLRVGHEHVGGGGVRDAGAGPQQFLEQTLSLTLASARAPALLKAMLINGSRSLGAPYDYQVQSSINYQGWGLPSPLTNIITRAP